MGKISKAVARFGAPPEALIFDDGELDSIEPLMEDLRLEYAHLRGDELEGSLPMPMKVLIATCSQFMELASVSEKSAFTRPTHIAVIPPDVPYDLQGLQENGADYVLHFPLHESVLRLLLLNLLYRGPEKRRAPRTAIGSGILYRSGPLKRKATLADLSINGCRLISRYGARPGIPIRLDITHAAVPETIGLGISGMVLRSSAEEPGANPGEIILAVEFDELSDSASNAIQALIDFHQSSPTSWREEFEDAPVDAAEHHWGPMPPPAQISAEEMASDQFLQERRDTKRGVYDHKVIALVNEASRVLMGRDLSAQGMRLQPHSDLTAGDRVQLALHGSSLEQPLVIEAEITRDDGDEGLAVVFHEVTESIAEQLSVLVQDLPSIEAVEAEALIDTMFAEILEKP